MRPLCNAALCLCVLLTLGGSVPAQQRKELTDAEKVRRLDVVPEPAPAFHPKFYPGTSFQSLRVPETEYGYVSANNRNFYYEKVGYGTENIVVIHGGPGLPHDYLLPALQNLAPYATIWFYDARGHGLSEQNYPNESYTMQQLVDDIDAFVKAANLRNFTLFGHSFGGMVALKYATGHHPGLTRIVLSDTSASLDYINRFQESLKHVMPAGQYDEYEKIQADTSKTPDERLRSALRLVYPFYWYNPPKPQFLDTDIGSMNLNATASEQIWGSDGQSYDVRKDLAKVTVPVMVFYGRYDVVFSYDDAKEIADGVPDGKLVVLERSGHYPFFEENYLFTQWVRTFLEYYSA